MATPENLQWLNSSLEMMLSEENIHSYISKNNLQTSQSCSKPLAYWRRHRHEIARELDFTRKDGDIITQVLQKLTDGIRAERDGRECARCKAVAKYRCSRCARAMYCSPACQRAHWSEGHARECAPRAGEGAAASSGTA